MMDAIFSYLKSDSELSSLLGTPTNPNIYPFEHYGEDDPFIVYSYSPVVSSEALTQYRVELRIVSRELTTVQSIEKAVVRLMHFRRKSGFQHNDETVYNSLHVGGGMMKNPDNKKYEQFLIFNVTAN
jgi:hypothetical protein